MTSTPAASYSVQILEGRGGVADRAQAHAAVRPFGLAASREREQERTGQDEREREAR
jgi:hypothetical protein